MMTICGRPRAASGASCSRAATSRELRRTKSRGSRIAQSPEGRRIFPRMTVLENLQMGAIIAKDPEAFEKDLDRVYTLSRC